MGFLLKLNRNLRIRAAACAIVFLLVCVFWARFGPLPAGILKNPAGESTVVVDRRGVVLYEALSNEGARAMGIKPESLPSLLVAATVAAEDRRFWGHPGIDTLAVVRAAFMNLRAGRVVQGGSTITQQVAKLLLNRLEPQRRRGLYAKFKEAIVAVRLEHRFSKRELLAMYLNLASYGNQFIGVERASRGYLGVPAELATPAQAAFLAGLPQRPTGFNPYRRLEAAIARQNVVLRRMAANGALEPSQLREALQEKVSLARQDSAFLAPHFVEMVLNSTPDPRPARIQTTLDSRLQADVVGIVNSHQDLLRTHGASNVAVVVLENATGEWLAWEGSGDYYAANGGAINGPLTLRQPGSALKPFTYALAFENGFSPASVLADVPSTFPTAEPGIIYSPRNYDGRYRGPLLIRRALAGSENVPAVALASEIGVPALLRFLSRAGITTLNKTAAHYGLGLTLGNAEVRLDELVAAYAAFARGGEWIEPAAVRRTNPASRNHTSLVSSRTAFWVTDILSDPEAREFIFGRGGSLEFPFPVAVKTGTSQAYHDNWTVGYSRNVTVGVWVGNFDRSPLRNSSGVTGAAPIFHAVMLAAERRYNSSASLVSTDPILQPPAGVVRSEICALSGMAANEWCPVRKLEWVRAEANALPCSWHHLSDEGLLTIWPPEYQQWAHANGLNRADAAAEQSHEARISSGKRDARANNSRNSAAQSLEIVSPPDGATYSIDSTLRREFQTLTFRALAQSADRIEWTVSGRIVGTTNANSPLHWRLVPGQHRVTARDQRGQTATSKITVK